MKNRKLRLTVNFIIGYLAFTAAYSAVRVPIGSIVLTFARGRHPDELGWAMWYADLVVYWPYRAAGAALEALDHTWVGQALIGLWVAGFIVTLIVNLAIGVFRTTRRVLEHLVYR